MTRPRACLGEATVSVREGGDQFAQCAECETKVRVDLVDDPFFGFGADCDFLDDEDEEA